MLNETYILDSNVFINFYDRYYRIEYFPTFWQEFIQILNDKVVIPQIIVNENFQNPWFKKWIDVHYRKEIVNHLGYINEWKLILDYINDSELYRKEAINQLDKGWGNEKIADPWLIAIAQKEGHIIVTEEMRNPNLSDKYPSRVAKIPDVCDALCVECINMNDFFNYVNLKV